MLNHTETWSPSKMDTGVWSLYVIVSKLPQKDGFRSNVCVDGLQNCFFFKLYCNINWLTAEGAIPVSQLDAFVCVQIRLNQKGERLVFTFLDIKLHLCVSMLHVHVLFSIYSHLYKFFLTFYTFKDRSYNIMVTHARFQTSGDNYNALCPDRHTQTHKKGHSADSHTIIVFRAQRHQWHQAS